SFEDLKSQWKGQSQPETPIDGANQIVRKMDFIKKKQRIMNVVLGITALILIGFFFYVSAYRNQTVFLGLLLMLLALAIRIGIEIFSLRKLNTMDVMKDVGKFRRQMLTYYTNRKKVHFVATPFSVLMYCAGFMMLLPAFKASLSSGFYTYIVVSSIVLLVVLVLFIAFQIKKEMNILQELKEDN
ncbi:MAG: hypothetical protein WA913_08330, partial [Pricia sp.]